MKLKNQSGRSMVEMLGVLAVIGVLSVGGIYGYRYAMDQYKFNKYVKLLDTVAMSVAIENGKGEDSIFLSGMGDSLSGATKWCSAYGNEWCQEQRQPTNYVLSEKESGVTASAVYWALRTTSHTYCFANTDITFDIYNIKPSTCDKLVDILYDKYLPILAGSYGRERRSVAWGKDEMKETMCWKDGTASDNDFTHFGIVFVGAENDTTSFGSCHSRMCPELCE